MRVGDRLPRPTWPRQRLGQGDAHILRYRSPKARKSQRGNPAARAGLHHNWVDWGSYHLGVATNILADAEGLIDVRVVG